MMAFVGSYATQELGYPNWQNLLQATLPFNLQGLLALEFGQDLGRHEWISTAWKALSDPAADRIVLYELLNEFLQTPGVFDVNLVDENSAADFRRTLVARVLELFSLQAATKERDRSTVWQISRNLGIRRIITTNYDMEFEYELMIDDDDRWRGVDPAHGSLAAREEVFNRCYEAGQVRRARALVEEGAASRYDFTIEHSMPDSRRIVSDCFQRERSDKLFEFAIGSPDPAWHVMHLHGRISDPETLIISFSDYERQYRQSSITKLPFVHAMKLLFAGNPILFVGMGMSEEEILAVLRQFVSDGQPGYVARHFVIWSTRDGKVSSENELFRLRLYRQYGVHVLFDSELGEGFYSQPTWEEALPASIDSLARFAEARVKPFAWDKGGWRSARNRSILPAGSVGSPLTQGGDFRDMQGYLPIPARQNAGPRQKKEDLAARSRKLSAGSLIWAGKNSAASSTNLDSRTRFSAIEIPYSQHSDPEYDQSFPWASGATPDPDTYFKHVVSGGSPIKAFIDHPGSGHGNLASVIGDFVLEQVSLNRRLKVPLGAQVQPLEVLYFQINGSFTWELDSAFSLVSGLFDDRTAYRAQLSRASAASQFFAQISAALQEWKPLQRALFIAINGADRFFDSSGYPLSNELDLLIRHMPQVRRELQRATAAAAASGDKDPPIDNTDSVLHDFVREKNGEVHPVTLLLFGTARVGRYLASLGFEQGDLGKNRIADFDIIPSSPEPFPSSEPVPGTFFSQLCERVTIDGSPNPFRAVQGETIASLYFRSVRDAFARKLKRSLRELVPIALLTSLSQVRSMSDGDARRAFFDVYLDARLLAKVLAKEPKIGRARATLALDMLRVLAFLGQPSTCGTLSLALTGARKPLGSEAAKVDPYEVETVMKLLLKLNLVLEVEQYPGINLGGKIHHRYGLHRALLHELRDRNNVPFSDARNYTSFNIPLFTAQPIDDHEPEDHVQRVIEHMIGELIDARPVDIEDLAGLAGLEYGMHLRAACASMRSYYTTSTLLMHTPEPFPSERHSPKLPNHAELLSRLIHWAEETARARRRITDPTSPPNFFPDDLVWLHAQCGVAHMAYGDLYGARDSLGKAASINEGFVEFGDHGQNWRRIQLNQIDLDIERAKIASAEARIRDLKTSINRAVTDETWKASWRMRIGEKMPRNAFEAIMQAYGNEPRLRVREVDPFFAADLILSTGLACGYRGWCEYLRGRLRTAEHYFSHCIQILRNIGEQRAYAVFARHYSSLLHAIEKRPEGESMLLLCQAAADSSRQMDISHLAALSRAEHRFLEAPAQERAELVKSVMDTLRYATLTDMYRIRLEARRVLALMRFRDGDFDGALEQASEALAVAARFGFTLRKISLRILVGQILVKRGDPISGMAMLEQASRIADRLGYQRAVEEVYRVRMGT